MTFHIGQKVVCVDAAVRERPCSLKKDNIYTITNTGIFLSDAWVAVAEARPADGSIGFYADRFRPVVEKKTDISMFTALLNQKQHADSLCGND
jgi:hypothetical protein